MRSEAEKRKDRYDIVNNILEECILAFPVSSFVISLYKQYQKRGSLSKKQLQGLYGKASEIEGLNPGKLATLLALIQKMPTRYKSELPEMQAEENGKEELQMLDRILTSFPNHKGALLLHSKLKTGGKLSPREVTDLDRFAQLITRGQA